jgi:hypothetical protein
MIRYAVLAYASVIALTVAANAGVADGIVNSCRPDYHRICSDVPPGDGRAARCLLDHQAELSPNCLKTLKIASAVKECTQDYRRLCPGVPTGPQAFQCLADRMNMLAPGCRRVVAANLPYVQPRGERYSYKGAPALNFAPPPFAGPTPYGAGRTYDGGNAYGNMTQGGQSFGGYGYVPGPAYTGLGAALQGERFRP